MFKKFLVSLSFAFALGFIGSTVKAEVIGAANSPSSTAEFLNVFNQDNGSHTDGQVLIVATVSVANGIEVTTTTTAGSTAFIGVCKGTIPARSYGRVQVSGYHAAVLITAATSVGSPLNPSATAGKFDVVSSSVPHAAIALDISGSVSCQALILRK